MYKRASQLAQKLSRGRSTRYTALQNVVSVEDALFLGRHPSACKARRGARMEHIRAWVAKHGLFLKVEKPDGTHAKHRVVKPSEILDLVKELAGYTVASKLERIWYSHVQRETRQKESAFLRKARGRPRFKGLCLMASTLAQMRAELQRRKEAGDGE